MAWEHAKQIFPNHTPALSDGTRLTPEELMNRTDLQILGSNRQDLARNMIILDRAQFWGENGEYAVTINYDIYNDTNHPDPNYYPLSVYGQAMINNFLYLNHFDS